MIARVSALRMGVGRFSRHLRKGGVITMPDVGLDTMRRNNVPPGAGVLRVLVPGVAVEIFIDGRSVADGVEVTH
jgi:hypothetical protein